MRRHIPLLTSLALLLSTAAVAAPIRVVTTLSSYASIARMVGGDRVEVSSISTGSEDAHFVKPKPSFALMLSQADLFVSTGLDLEAWAPVLVEKSGNAKIRDGASGYVNASQGVKLLDIPTSIDRSAGDVHIFGNPHIFTSPLNAKVIAENIASGLKRVDHEGAAIYEANLKSFDQRVDEALYGKELVALLGSETLDPLAQNGQLISFLDSQDYQGKKLTSVLGGWLGKALPLRGKLIVCYHKNWIYFMTLFGIDVLDYVEPKPGIPPSARHVHELLEEVQKHDIKILFAANYFGESQIRTIAERLGVKPVIVPLGPDPGGAKDYFGMVDLWVDGLVAALGA